MKKIKNKFTQHLLDFGKMIKTNGHVLEESDYQKAYMLSTKDYDYCFKTMNENGSKIHLILVMKNFGTKNGKEYFSPLFALWFSEDGKMNLQNNVELETISIPGIETLDERYYGEW